MTKEKRDSTVLIYFENCSNQKAVRITKVQ